MLDEMEISLLELLQGIRKRISLIILLTVLFTGTSFGISHMMPKEYQSYSTMLLGLPEVYGKSGQDNVGISAADISLNRNLVGTYREFIKSRVVSEEVIANLGLDMSYESFRDKLEVSSLKDTEMITIKVTDTIPLRAKDIANETADIFKIKVADAFKIDNVQIVDYAVIPTSPIKPNIKLNTAIGGLLGLMIGIFIALFLMSLDTSIKTAQDIENHIGLPVLGTIPLEKSTKRGRK